MQNTKVQVKMTSSEQSLAHRRKASEIFAKVMQTTRIEVVQILKRYVVRVYAGIVPGIQCVKFDDKREATAWAVELYGFYSNRLGRQVDLNMNI